MNTWIKDPDAVLDYVVDWSDWLEDGETISSHSVAVASGDVTIDSDSHTDTLTVAWVSGGTKPSKVRHRVTTSAGRTDDRTISLNVLHR